MCVESQLELRSPDTHPPAHPPNPPGFGICTWLLHTCRTPTSVVFESYYPDSVSGGTQITSFTYTGSYNFVPGPELVHINFCE